MECEVIGIATNEFRTLMYHNLSGTMIGREEGGFANTWPEPGSPVLWILDQAVSTRERTLAPGRRIVLSSPGRMIVGMVVGSTVGDPGVRGTIKTVDLANGRVQVEVPWNWSHPLVYAATLDPAASYTWKGAPSDAKQALGVGRQIEIVRPRPLTVSVLSEKTMAREPDRRDDRLLPGTIQDVGDLARGVFKLAVETNGSPTVVEIQVSRLMPILMDARVVTLEEAVQVGRHALCLGGTKPGWLIVSSGQAGDPRGDLVSVKEDGRSLRLTLKDGAESRDVGVSLDENPVFTLDHAPATREEALRPGCHVTVLPGRLPRVIVTEPKPQTLW